MRDSDTPVQPKSAKAKAVCSAAVWGGVRAAVAKRVEGMRARIASMGGLG